MTTLFLKVRQQRQMMEERMAGSLVAALRSGALDFNLAPPGTRSSVFWSVPDEVEETRLQLIPSRYRLLGYPRQLPAARLKELPAPSKILGVHLLGSATTSPDENLLLGVPMAMLKLASPDDNAGETMISAA